MLGTTPAQAADRFLPHGFCFLWNRPLLWTHVVSDVLIGVSYLVIAYTLVHFIRRARQDLPFSYIFVAFGLFIVACGGTHFMEVWTFWQPVYWASAGVKVVTAVASVSTAAVLPVTVPRVHLTIREAKLARERERAAARAAALEEANAELARLNASLESALAEAQAARAAADEARRAAESASAVKSDFLAVMSHELRTPLQAVMGYADLLQLGVSGPVTEAQVAHLGRIRGSAQHLMGLIDEILTFSRLEARTERLEPAPCDAVEVALEAADMVRPLAAARGLEFTVEAPAPGALPVHTDPRRLRQTVLNLLSNAVKYTPTGRVSLEVVAEPPAGSTPNVDPSHPGGLVHFVVRDTGIGIAPEEQARVFDPFWQAAPALTRDVGGTGLGLSVARGFAEAMGGTITVASEVGVGSTFTLTVPRAAPQAAAR